MELTKIDNAFKIYTRIKELDAEIIEIDKIAMQLANDDTDVSFELKVKNYTPDAKNEVVEEPDEMSVYQKMLSFHTFSGLYMSSTPEKNTDTKTTTFSTKIATSNSLKILGILLADKIDRRNILIKKLQKHGVKI